MSSNTGKQVKVKKNKEYYQLSPKPSERMLKDYYENIYFQQLKGSYEKTYSKNELLYFHNNNSIISTCLKRIFKEELKTKSLLDLGSGEGWTLKYFHKAGCKVFGVDFSSHGISKFNKPMLKYFVESEILEFIDKCITENKKFDIINLTNVIEHVLYPEQLLISIKKILSSDGVVIVTFPNDFSSLQDLLLKKKKISNAFWVVSPDHISYFNKSSFSKLSKRLGYAQQFYLADFPIDLYLLNDNSNYVSDKTKGKQAHLSRIEFINLICEHDLSNATDFLLSLGNIGFGRNLTAFLKSK
ncbi:MAG: hypothetical protein A2499_18995 [Stygiobacter sp. RIFOXYC12_FULL_38_8]|nr:MAG: hypothetical protein A2X62_16435 [Stygiobacter sp. GWC2_38_9]OGU78736.1 MAG: hypothetical protein A2279_09745 [Stygiobacter sp. RIFOXYA12_FULL_38_9]OGV06782.1 MAG: hypothetical protein A2299_11080 [Stygiobacter sp. RIFOXYB2_FULL_37_11]OGV13414.1 MAG: hypothetical protein A2440_19280 [Stygiobacter sp. RIFOXYC2_FULL_38_25]OGV17939.1 MAG: hypothetical protein A2237_08130 [Stygiobacter sp. RIFOXYA2_FULL_38_8]OGV29199.1 MAG: hypothetical protein A2499_18995 [Stygiobacter sp. RIFOXYC12_FULL_